MGMGESKLSWKILRGGFGDCSDGWRREESRMAQSFGRVAI